MILEHDVDAGIVSTLVDQIFVPGTDTQTDHSQLEGPVWQWLRLGVGWAGRRKGEKITTLTPSFYFYFSKKYCPSSLLCLKLFTEFHRHTKDRGYVSDTHLGVQTYSRNQAFIQSFIASSDILLWYRQTDKPLVISRCILLIKNIYFNSLN